MLSEDESIKIPKVLRNKYTHIQQEDILSNDKFQNQ